MKMCICTFMDMYMCIYAYTHVYMYLVFIFINYLLLLNISKLNGLKQHTLIFSQLFSGSLFCLWLNWALYFKVTQPRYQGYCLNWQKISFKFIHRVIGKTQFLARCWTVDLSCLLAIGWKPHFLLSLCGTLHRTVYFFKANKRKKVSWWVDTVLFNLITK